MGRLYVGGTLGGCGTRWVWYYVGMVLGRCGTRWVGYYSGGSRISKRGGARSAPQNLAPPTFYILMARAHAHHMNRTEHEHLS